MGVSLLGFCVAGLHCGGGISSLCEEKIACEGGNDADQSACEIEGDTNQEIADLEGCTAEWDELFDCREENLRCNNNRYEVDDKKCLQEADRFDRCMD